MIAQKQTKVSDSSLRFVELPPPSNEMPQASEEKRGLAEQIKATRKALEKASSKTLTKEAFLSIVRNTRAKKLTLEMVNELIDHIEVHQAEKVDGVWEQRVTIYYNVVGPIIIPEGLPLPVPDVIVNTRRGVNVTYAGAQKSE